MTRRRDLEQAVIEAAREALESPVWGIDYRKNDLFDAFSALDQLREIEKPRAAACAPITSRKAAEWAYERQASWHARIFCKLYWAHSAGYDGHTADEVIRDMNGTHQTVSARINELSNAGWIVDSGKTRKTRTGAEAIVWRVSAAACQAVKEGRAQTQ